MVEGVGGAAGEGISQLAIGEDVDIKELVLEATGGGPISTVSGINQIINPGKYTLNGKPTNRSEVWNVLSNKKLTDKEIVEMDLSVENDPVLEEEIKARTKAYEKLAALPKDKDGNDIISFEDRESILKKLKMKTMEKILYLLKIEKHYLN